MSVSVLLKLGFSLSGPDILSTRLHIDSTCSEASTSLNFDQYIGLWYKTFSNISVTWNIKARDYQILF